MSYRAPFSGVYPLAVMPATAVVSVVLLEPMSAMTCAPPGPMLPSFPVNLDRPKRTPSVLLIRFVTTRRATTIFRSCPPIGPKW